MEYPWDQEVQVCRNEVPVVINAPGKQFYIGIYSKKLTKSSSHEPLAGIHFKLTWIILITKRFKFA